METAELKKTIDRFFRIQQQNESEMLEKANTIKDLIELILEDSAGNGLRKTALRKARQIIEATEDPRALWHELNGIMFVHPVLGDLRASITSRVAVLINKVSAKSVPDWFGDLLQNPQHIPEGFLAIVCKKAREIQDALDGRAPDDSGHQRTIEKGRC